VVDFITELAERSELPLARLIAWLGISESKYFAWKHRYGKANEHNGRVPRDHWLQHAEREAILGFYARYPMEGYRRLTYMMLDANVVAVSASSVYRVLRQAGLLRRWAPTSSSKGSGFVQPLRAHAHWHIDVTYLNVRGTFFYMLSVLDGFSRAILHHEIRETMTQHDVQIVVERTRERYPGQHPRIISDNGPQFVARDFKAYLRQAGMDHVTTSPYYPASNGKIERFHGTLKRECIRPRTPLSLEDARRVVAEFVAYYNGVRLHSAIGYVTPLDKLNARDTAIFEERDRKLEAARERRARARAEDRLPTTASQLTHRTENSILR
jgi:putative transposase